LIDRAELSMSAAASAGATGVRLWSVGALLRTIADSLDAKFNPVSVTGEISGYSRAASGHCYFSLKDAQGQVRCAMFRRASNLLDFSPRDGQQVELRGRLGVYEPRGELQLIVESMRQAGQGNLFEQFLVLKAQLDAEGLFSSSRKRPLPLFPAAIGIVTSLGAAALHDVISVLRRRVPHIATVIYPASVQGAQAAGELQKALVTAAARREVDILLLVRGGGGIEDLWAFNDATLARTIVQSPIPVVTGIGHETDFTIADFCADVRAPTPTAAAELSAQPQIDWLKLQDTLQSRLEEGSRRQLESAWLRLDRAAATVSRPSHVVASHHARLSDLALRLRHGAQTEIRRHARAIDVLSDLPERVASALSQRQRRLEQTQLHLQLLDPRLVLQRGYAWLADMQGQPLTRALALHPGQAVRATLCDGEVDLTVTRPRLI
jgi:exodeoxyribonuclease VII large subunit